MQNPPVLSVRLASVLNQLEKIMEELDVPDHEQDNCCCPCHQTGR